MRTKMPKERLNLTVDPDALERGRRYAERHGTSVSQLVTDFLAALPDPDAAADADLSPGVRRLLGIARGGTTGDYRRYLEEEHGA